TGTGAIAEVPGTGLQTIGAGGQDCLDGHGLPGEGGRPVRVAGTQFAYDKGTIPRDIKGSIEASHFVGGRGQGKEVIVPMPGSAQKGTRAAGCGDTGK